MPSSMSLEKELGFIEIGYACFPIPKFRGEKEEFTGCLSKVERVFACCILSDQEKFKVVISRLSGCALQWWNNYKFERRKKGKEKVRTWKKLSSKLKGSFCPFTYTPMKESIPIKPIGSFPSTPQKEPNPQMIVLLELGGASSATGFHTKPRIAQIARSLPWRKGKP